MNLLKKLKSTGKALLIQFVRNNKFNKGNVLSSIMPTAMTVRRKISSATSLSPVDGLLMDRLSVIARNRGMGGHRLGPHTSHYCMQLSYQTHLWKCMSYEMFRKINMITHFIEQRNTSVTFAIIPKSGEYCSQGSK